MLDLEFRSKSIGTNPNYKKITHEWAVITCTDDKNENVFEFADYTIEGIKVFQNDCATKNEVEGNFLSAIRKIVKDNDPEAVLISTISVFMKVVHFSNKKEMNPKMTVTEDRTPVFYAMVGKDNCALLIAWDKYFGDEDEEEYE